MSNKKFRWSKVYESSEEELVEFLLSRGIEAERFEIDAFDERQEQASDSALTLWCADGSLYVQSEAAKASLQPGDAIRINPGTTSILSAGISGCACYVSREAP